MALAGPQRPGCRARRAAARDARGRSRGLAQVRGVEAIDVGVADLLAVDHADADTLRDRVLHALQAIFLEEDAGVDRVLRVDLAEVAAARQGATQDLFDEFACEEIAGR